MSTGLWEVYALRYAYHGRMAMENFIGGDPHDNSPMPLDYFIWAIVFDERVFVVDTGFDEVAAKKRGRNLVHSPSEGLKAIGIDPAKVENVIITHMHITKSRTHDISLS